MKQSQLLVIVLLILLIVVGWGSAIVDVVDGDNDEYKEHLELAEDYYNRGLYQKAAQEYEAAIVIKSDEKGWDHLLMAYSARYEESDDIYDAYLEAATRANTAYPENPDYLLAMAKLHMDGNANKVAYKCLHEAISAGMDDPRVIELEREAKYSFELLWAYYSEYGSCVNGYYAVKNFDSWDYLSEDGSEENFARLMFAGAVSPEGIRVCYDGKKAILVDSDKVTQGILNFVPEETAVYADGLIAIRSSGKYAYYNVLGDRQFGDYEQAGTFTEGVAAVCNDGAWYLIDVTGAKVSDAVYEDIILNVDGTHIKKGVMLAKKDGVYRIFDSKGNPVSDFSCSDIDVVTDDGLIAYCNNGKWGFVNTSGEQLILPTYEAAKSFSNGLAAVCNGGKWGFVNQNNELVIGYQFLDTDYFNGAGCCMVCTDEREIKDEAQNGEEASDSTTQQPVVIERTWQLLSRLVPNA